MHCLKGLLLFACVSIGGACTDGRPVEEPVRSQPDAPGASNTPQPDDTGFDAGDATFEGPGNVVESTAAPAEVPAATPEPQDPTKASGGGIPNGSKTKAGDECAKIANKAARKDCVERVRKAIRN